MCVGSLLLKPQPVRRAAGRPSLERLADDLAVLVPRILADPEAARAAGEALEGALQGLVEGLLLRAGNGLEAAIDRLGVLVGGMRDGLTTFVEGAPDLSEAAAFGDAVEAGVAAVQEFLQGLDANGLRALVGEGVEVVESDLGLNPEFLQEAWGGFMDDAAAALEDAAAAAAGEARATLLHAAVLFRRIRRELHPLLQLPGLDADAIALDLLALLRRLGVDTLAEKASCFVEKLRAVLEGGDALVGMAPGGSFGPGTVGAAALAQPPSAGDTYAWYASWLEKRRAWWSALFDWVVPNIPDPEVWVTADGTQVVRRGLRGEEALALRPGAAPPLAWNDAAIYSDPATEPRYTLGKADFLEHWTRWAWAARLSATTVLNGIGIAEKGDRYSNLLLAVWNLADTLVTSIRGSPLVSTVNAAIGGRQWPRIFLDLQPLMVFAASWEGFQDEADADAGIGWMILFADDVNEAYWDHRIPDAVHDGLLSIFTLVSYSGPAGTPAGEDNRPLNREHIDGVVWPVITLFDFLMVKAYKREEYIYPFAPDNTAHQLLFWLLVHPIFRLMGAFLGTCLSWAFSRAPDPVLLADSVGRYVLPVYALGPHVTARFWFGENDTDGEYNPRGGAFDGYPDPSSSPYRLPFQLDTAQMCEQGNQGLASHNDFSTSMLVYAYDFPMDQGEPVLAARDGTVVDFFDWAPDNERITTDAGADADPGQTQSSTGNFIFLRHDDPFGRETADQRSAHDRGAGGAEVVTFGHYLHGRQESVRELLMPDGGTPADIIGLQIRRGTPIMRAGNTGRSAHNHLHMDVRTNGAALGTHPAVPPPVTRDAINTGGDRLSLPFVFKEVTNILGKDGVPRSLRFYVSANDPAEEEA
jgi:hypothetical protein